MENGLVDLSEITENASILDEFPPAKIK